MIPFFVIFDFFVYCLLFYFFICTLSQVCTTYWIHVSLLSFYILFSKNSSNVFGMTVNSVWEFKYSVWLFFLTTFALLFHFLVTFQISLNFTWFCSEKKPKVLATLTLNL